MVRRLGEGGHYSFPSGVKLACTSEDNVSISEYSVVDLFSRIDGDGDGFLSKSEIEKKGLPWKTLTDYDLNSTYARNVINDDAIFSIAYQFYATTLCITEQFSLACLWKGVLALFLQCSTSCLVKNFALLHPPFKHNASVNISSAHAFHLHGRPLGISIIITIIFLEEVGNSQG